MFALDTYAVTSIRITDASEEDVEEIVDGSVECRIGAVLVRLHHVPQNIDSLRRVQVDWAIGLVEIMRRLRARFWIGKNLTSSPSSQSREVCTESSN